MKTKDVLKRWHKFLVVTSNSEDDNLKDFRLMMVQLLEWYPFRKLPDLSDRDLLRAVNLDDKDDTQKMKEFFRFLEKLEAFLECHGWPRETI